MLSTGFSCRLSERSILELEWLDDELELLEDDELVLRFLRGDDVPFVSDSLSVLESRLSP